VQLRQEALKDIVLAYAHVDAIDGAVAYLAEKAGADAVEAIQRLAATYFDDGKFEQAIRVYRILQARAPGHAKAPAWQQKVLLAYDKLNRRDQVVTEMKRLVGEYGPQSGWAKTNTAERGALAEARDLAEASLRELVDAAKVEERKDKGHVDRGGRNLPVETVTRNLQPEPIPENEQKLIAACDRYLQLTPDAKDEIVIRYKAAFLFYERRHFVEAAKRFGEIILRWPTDSWSQKAAELSLDILNTGQEWQ